jgi:carbamoyltransferase
MREHSILGLATMGDSAAAIAVGGRLVAAVEEERISRRKYDGAFPYGAIGECLRIAGMSMDEIDQVCVYWQPWRLMTRAAFVASRALTRARDARAMFARVSAVFSSAGHNDDNEYPQMAGRWDELFRVRRLLSRAFGRCTARISFFDHHACHANSGRVLLPDGDALCLTFDGGGEEHSTVVGCFTERRFETFKRIRWPNSLGHYYSTFTGYLGFRIREGEYKMMGLASYGSPKYASLIREHIISPRGNGEYLLNNRLIDYHAAIQGRFTKGLTDLLGPPRKSEDPVEERHKDIAASVQAVFETTLFDLLHWAKLQRPHVRQLILAGGCALNATANGKVADSGLFDRVVVPPAPHDAGGAIGAVAIGATLASDRRAQSAAAILTIPGPYLGSVFGNAAVEAAFAGKGLPPPQRLPPDALISAAADALAAGEVIAWFQGAAEFGPRALGNRSFLADPRFAHMRDRINERVKHREPFRPFAPSVKAELAAQYFEMSQPSPHMNIVSKVRADQRAALQAVTHVDGTARVHTVTREANERYWLLIDAFERRTGIPVLLNSSFNIREPIVNAPSQAIATFLSSNADKLFINDFICDRGWRGRVSLRVLP